MEKELPKTNEELKNIKEKYINKVFWLTLQIAFIFLIPALFGVWLGKNLDKSYNGGEQKFAPFVLFFTFILSWIVVLVYYNKLSKKLKKVNKKIKDISDNK